MYNVVLAYMPSVGSAEWNPYEYGETMLPKGIEVIHPRYSISWRNKWMVNESDIVVCYINRSWGGVAKYVEMAAKKGKTNRAVQQWATRFFLCRDSVSQDFVITKRIISAATAVTGVSLNSIHSTVLYFFYDTYMIGKTVLRSGRTIWIVPIKENNHAGCRFSTVVCPLTTLTESVDAVYTTRKLWNNARFDIPTLVGTPRYKAG